MRRGMGAESVNEDLILILKTHWGGHPTKDLLEAGCDYWAPCGFYNGHIHHPAVLESCNYLAL